MGAAVVVASDGAHEVVRPTPKPAAVAPARPRPKLRPRRREEEENDGAAAAAAVWSAEDAIGAVAVAANADAPLDRKLARAANRAAAPRRAAADMDVKGRERGCTQLAGRATRKRRMNERPRSRADNARSRVFSFPCAPSRPPLSLSLSLSLFNHMVLLSLGFPLAVAVAGVAALGPVSGRGERARPACLARSFFVSHALLFHSPPPSRPPSSWRSSPPCPSSLPVPQSGASWVPCDR